jgi:hypothetical protein
MTLQQTIEIPRTTRHLAVDFPQDIPAGTVEMVLFFPAPAVSPVKAKPLVDEEINLRPTSEEIRRISEEIDSLNLQPALSIEEALVEADRRAKAEAADPCLRSLKKWHGVWENSKAWGKDVDVVAEIRKMRDEWGDPWAEAQNG